MEEIREKKQEIRDEIKAKLEALAPDEIAAKN